jgi:hypothetical protein
MAAQADIQNLLKILDPGLRRGDVKRDLRTFCMPIISWMKYIVIMSSRNLAYPPISVLRPKSFKMF